MALLQILPITDPRLTQACAEAVFEIGDAEHVRLKKLAVDMLETCKVVGGAGMAAPQVGEMTRMFVMSLAMYGQIDEVFINPVIIASSVETVSKKEGCLSMPELFFEVDRYKSVTIRYQNSQGLYLTYVAEGHAAIVAQHEIDHLDGIRHVDHLSPLKRGQMIKKFKKHVMKK